MDFYAGEGIGGRLGSLMPPYPFLVAPAAGITLARSARKEIWVLGVSPLLAN